MKDVAYNHSYSSDLSREDEMKAQFGELLNTEDTADSYEVAESHLYKKGSKYFWIQASGCSCWDGDYYGWELTKTELKALAKKRADDEDGYSGAGHEKLMGQWIKENIK
jgi:hypothetical protein